MTRERETIGVGEDQLTSSWRSLGRGMSKFFNEANSWMGPALARPALPDLGSLLKLIVNRGQQTGQGLVEMFRTIRRGDWGLFVQWAKADPLAVLAGIGAIIAAAIGVKIAVTGLVAGAGGLWAWATSGSTGLMALIKGGTAFASVGGILAGLTKAGRFVYNFEWQETDEDIDKAIDQAITNLYEPMGEFVGRSMAGIIVGGISRPPQIEINTTQIALMAELNEDIRDDLYDAVTDFIYTGMSTLLGVAIKLAYKNVRNFIISSWHKSPDEFKKTFANIQLPGGNKLGASIEAWGSPSSEPWSFKRWLSIDEKVEKIEDEKVKGLVEGFLDGFWDQWIDSVQYVSAFR